MALSEIKQIIEALIFVSNEPIGLSDLQDLLDEFPPKDVQAAIEELSVDFESGQRGLVIGQAGGGYQMLTSPAADPWIRKLLKSRTQSRLTLAALETLAIIAYKQPMTLPEILALRKVNSTGVIKTLLDKNLIRIVGRKKVVGNPILYGTTKEFLLRFGLNSLKDLPSLDEFQSLVEATEGEILRDDEDSGAAPMLENGDRAAEGAPAAEEGESDADKTDMDCESSDAEEIKVG